MEESKELQFTVTMEEANTIVSALSELPAKVSMALIQKLQIQAQPQIEKGSAPEEAPGA
jgi:hypothetical protein